MIINGEQVTLPAESTVADVVAHVTGAADTAGVAVAVNEMVVPRSMWSTVVDSDAVVEVLSAVQGG